MEKREKNHKPGLLMKILAKIMFYPRLMFHVVNWKRIKNGWKYFRLEGIGGVTSRFKNAKNVEKYFLNAVEQNNLHLYEIKGEGSAENYTPIVFDRIAEPLVTIVIAMHNRFNYTYACLQSIYENTKDVPYEIILIHDCSTETAANIGKIIKNVMVVKNEGDIPFLLTCNQAVKHAKGRYLMFLQNDVQVQKGWLTNLLCVTEKDGTIGMAGPKLMMPDGRLQEAGGIVRKDASVWGYGHLCDGDEPEYNYIRDVDCLSGAAILVRASLWNEIGGFDVGFVPEGYENMDLAFEVRKHGYRAIYQPLSIAVHFGVDLSGKDMNGEQETGRDNNRCKFIEKWKNVLEEENIEAGKEIFTARDRSRFRKHILVVDHYVPHFDKDAGGKCCYMYLKLFLKLGMQVTFIGDDYIKHEPYTTELNQMGIEVLYGGYYRNNWQKWLEENLRFFDYVYLQRPQISIKYIDLVKKHSHAKVFYFAVDLHYLREYREYQLNHNPNLLKSSGEWKEMEYGLFRKADVGHVVGSFEQDIMQKAFPEKPIRNIPLYIYENLLCDINKDFEKRHNILFVGGFNHPPNIDGVIWFAKEVFPAILEKYPDIKWYVAGSNPPPQIKELASRNILIEGFVEDDKLQQLYRECRLAVVPLRVGAGVKGKVVEAAYYQIPLVTTSIGAEGLSRKEGFMEVEDDASGLAGAICRLYEDFSGLRDMSDRGIEFIRKYFMLDEAERVLKRDL